MKKKLLFLVAIVGMAACSEVPDDIPKNRDDGTPIQLSAEIEAPVVTKSAIDGTTFPSKQEAVFYVTAYRGTVAPTAAYQTPHFSDVAVDTDDAGVLTLATTQYYPVDRMEKLYFYAYAPQATTLTAGSDVDAPIANYTITGQEDLLSAQHVVGISKADASETQEHPYFTFTHQLKQIKFKVMAGASFPTGIKITKITIKGVKTSAKLDVITGKVTFDATTDDIVAYSDATGVEITTTATDTPFGNVMFEPGATFVVSIVAGGVIYKDVPITLTGTDAGTAGRSHTVILTFKPTGITPTATITDWVKGDEAGVDVQ